MQANHGAPSLWRSIRIQSALLLAVTLSGAPALSPLNATEIVDFVQGPDNKPFTGTLRVTTLGGGVETEVANTKLINGALDLQLTPNAGFAQMSLYTAHFENSDASFIQVWSVPASPVPVRTDNIRLTLLEPTNVEAGLSTRAVASSRDTSSSQTASQQEVTDLQLAMTMMVQKGVGFGTDAVAVVDDNGILQTSVGDPGNCVLVDGTTAPCLSDASFSDAEIPGGTIDGVNNTFTLANTPSGSSLQIFRNGLFLSSGVDYTLSYTTNENTTQAAIQFVPGAVPQPGDLLVAFYRITLVPGGSASQQ